MVESYSNMKSISTIFFLIFSLSFQVAQGQQVLIPGPVSEYDFNQFDWWSFSDEENVQEQIDLRKQMFNLLGPSQKLIGLKADKMDLVRIELELELYRRGFKEGLLLEEIEKAEFAIGRYWGNIIEIEARMRGYAGLGIKSSEGIELFLTEPEDIEILAGSQTFEDYRNGVWELYEMDHAVLFSLVEKKYEDVYRELGEDDEKYAELILPSVENYMKRIEGFSFLYHEFVRSAYRGEIPYNEDLYKNNVLNLDKIYLRSLEIYDCFKKNFKNEVWGEHQEALESEILDWHTKQSMWGVDGYIEAYRRGLRSNPWATVNALQDFEKAPLEVRERIAEFYREEFLYKREFIDTDERTKLGARVRALIGLKYFGLLTEEEQELFDKAVSEGVIRPSRRGRNRFNSDPLPLPQERL